MSDFSVSKIANNSATLILYSRDTDVERRTVTTTPFLQDGVPVTHDTLSDANFDITLPSVVGFPHKSRCLCFVESVSGLVDANVADADDRAPPSVMVCVDAMAPQKVYFGRNERSALGLLTLKTTLPRDVLNYRQVTTGFTRQFSGHNTTPTSVSEVEDVTAGSGGKYDNAQSYDLQQDIEIVTDGSQNKLVNATYTNDGDILSNGVLCQSPFGKRIHVVLKDGGTGDEMLPHISHISGGPHISTRSMTKHPITIKMRLLFLDNDDLKDF